MEPHTGGLGRYAGGILSHYAGVFALLGGIFLVWFMAFGIFDNMVLCHGPFGSCTSLDMNEINFLLQVRTISLWVGLLAVSLGAILLLRSGISSRLADRRGRALKPF